MERYLRELSKIKTLEPAEEIGLWQRFKQHQDTSARLRLIESYQPLVFKQALPYRDMPDVMDLIQEGTVGLIESVESFDHARGVAFSLYAVHRIRGRMLDFLRRQGRAVTTRDSDYGEQAEQLSDVGPSVAELAESHELFDHLHAALERLPQNERAVLESIYIDSLEAKTVAGRLKLSVSHIYRLQKQGIRRIRGMLARFMKNF